MKHRGLSGSIKGEQKMPDTLDLLGGEQLDGSGFEKEIPEPDSDWRIPQ